MSIDEKSSINQQKREVFEQDHHVTLESACSIGNGILCIDDEARRSLIASFEENTPELSFFVPASGSGSRMFKFLFDYKSNLPESDEVKQFMDRLQDFAFYSGIPKTVRDKLSQLQTQYFAEYLLNEEGMNFGNLPKGLIPFHNVDGVIYNPFQEQVAQANKLISETGEMHFTVQQGYEEAVQASIDIMKENQKNKVSISFSNQDTNTDAYCFDLDGNNVEDENLPLRRPAGHGALIQNLNNLDSDITLIKNIDNVQHYNKSALSSDVWKMLVGLLLEFKSELKRLSNDFSAQGLSDLNDRFDFLSESEINSFDEEKIAVLASRPSRVCGMVVNEGAPGGGPFWINDGGQVTKQIVEGVQISGKDDQQKILSESSHFNPVFIALSKTDVDGNRLDLNNFVDDSKCLVVKKPHKGEEIIYRELPGLWNGAMSNWNTLFVEIPKEVFSPVKTALDLLKSAHQE